MIFSSKLLVLPSLLYSSNSTAGILSVLLIFLLEFVFLLFLIKIKQKNKNISFFNFFENKIGKFFTKIIIFLLFLFFLLKAIYLLQESFSFLKRSLYTEATVAIFLVCILPPVTAFAYKSLKAMGRTLEIFYVLIIALIAICLLVCAVSSDNLSLSVITSNGFSGFLEATYRYTFWFGDLLFFMYIIDKVEFDPRTPKQLIGYSLFSFVLVLAIFVVYFITFQTTSFAHTYALLDIIQFVSEYGTVGKFDIVPISAIMFIIYFQIGMMIFCASSCLQKVVPFGHKAQPLIVINFVLILMSYIVFNNANNLVIFYSDYLTYFSIFTSVVIPILFVIFGLTYKKKRGAK
jgi:hypothetical protein